MAIPFDPEAAHHQFAPVRTVAVVGCGASGAPAARHMRDLGLEVTVFERQESSGGVWGWSPVVAPPLAVPTPPPSTGAFFPSFPAGEPPSAVPREWVTPDADGTKQLRFNPPNPVYWSLTNNVPASTMQVRLFAVVHCLTTPELIQQFRDYLYPAGTPENVTHAQLATYVRGYVEHFGIDTVTQYNTRVEHAEKVPDDGGKWRLTLHQLEAVDGDGGAVREAYWTQVILLHKAPDN